jgi:hypothetical protein
MEKETYEINSNLKDNYNNFVRLAHYLMYMFRSDGMSLPLISKYYTLVKPSY